MNPKYFGDSYDIVKRFFCAELRTLGYSVTVEPMLTGDWHGLESDFYRFIGASPGNASSDRTAVFFDPDTGVHKRASQQHLSIQQLADASASYDLAFSFDQSFSRQHPPTETMRQKLDALSDLGAHGMYYGSHARFLFVASQPHVIAELRQYFSSLGLPTSRLLDNGA